MTTDLKESVFVYRNTFFRYRHGGRTSSGGRYYIVETEHGDEITTPRDLKGIRLVCDDYLDNLESRRRIW